MNWITEPTKVFPSTESNKPRPGNILKDEQHNLCYMVVVADGAVTGTTNGGKVFIVDPTDNYKAKLLDSDDTPPIFAPIGVGVIDPREKVNRVDNTTSHEEMGAVADGDTFLIVVKGVHAISVAANTAITTSATNRLRALTGPGDVGSTGATGPFITNMKLTTARGGTTGTAPGWLDMPFTDVDLDT